MGFEFSGVPTVTQSNLEISGYENIINSFKTILSNQNLSPGPPSPGPSPPSPSPGPTSPTSPSPSPPVGRGDDMKIYFDYTYLILAILMIVLIGGGVFLMRKR